VKDTHPSKESRDAIIGELVDVRAALIRERRRALRQASAAWFDLAIAYTRDTRRDSSGALCCNDAARTIAELDETLKRCTAELTRIGEMHRHFDHRIATVAYGELPGPQGSADNTHGLLNPLLRVLRERILRRRWRWTPAKVRRGSIGSAF